MTTPVAKRGKAGHRRPRFHPAGLTALLLALLVQAFAPDWAALAMRALPAADPNLCLAEEHPAGPAPSSHPQNHQALCPVCQAFAAVQTVLGSPSPALPTRRAIGRRLRRLPVRPAPRLRPILRPKARAPPVRVRSSVRP